MLSSGIPEESVKPIYMAGGAYSGTGILIASRSLTKQRPQRPDSTRSPYAFFMRTGLPWRNRFGALVWGTG
jgi:hypothetical protein